MALQFGFNPFGVRRPIDLNAPTKQNKFRGISFESGDPDVDPTPEEKNNRFSDLYQKLISTDPGPASKAYRDFLSSPEPQREAFKPTKMNRLAAILGGASEGIRHGAAEGVNTAQGILDRPYALAMGERGRRLEMLKNSADVEQSDIKNRTGMFKDILDAQGKEEDRAIRNRVADGQVRNYDSQITARDAEMKSKGFTATTNNITGHRIYTRIGPDGQPETIDTGVKVDETPGEKAGRQRGLAKYSSDLSRDRQKDVFNYTFPRQNSAANNRTLWGIAGAGQRQQSGQQFQREQAAGNPNTEYSRQYLAVRNVKVNHPELAGYFDENGIPSGPAVLEYAKELQKLKSSTPGLAMDDEPEIVGVTP